MHLGINGKNLHPRTCKRSKKPKPDLSEQLLPEFSSHGLKFRSSQNACPLCLYSLCLYCLECFLIVDDLLAGTRPLSPAGASDALDFNVLERIFGRKFSDVLSADNLLKSLSTTSRGDRGIIFAIPEKIDSNTIGHFFNFANQKDVVRFLDGQTGTAADLARFFRFRILRTN